MSVCSFERRLFVLLFGLEYHRLVSSSFLVCPSGVGIFFSKRRAPALCPHGTARSRRSGCSSGRCSPQRSAEEGESSLASSHFLWRPLEKNEFKFVCGVLSKKWQGSHKELNHVGGTHHFGKIQMLVPSAQGILHPQDTGAFQLVVLRANRICRCPDSLG